MPDLHSNCVILEFTEPITKHQLAVIERIIRDGQNNHFYAAQLPSLREAPVCGERESNCVVPTIAADED